MAVRKVLWSNAKEIKSKTPAARVMIPYPAKLLVNRVVMNDMCPDWGSVVGGYRIDTEKYFGVKKPVQDFTQSSSTLHGVGLATNSSGRRHNSEEPRKL